MNKLHKKLIFLFSEKLILYPYLIGVLFLLNELRKNALYNTICENIILIITILSFTLFTNYFCFKVFRDKTKSALLAALFILINLFFRDILLFISNQYLFLKLVKVISIINPNVIIFLMILTFWILFTLIILKYQRFSNKFNLYFNTLVTSYIIIELFFWVFLQAPSITLVDRTPFFVNTNTEHKKKPDIYYIILDSYTSSESLKKYWDYDNWGFEDSLKRLGFNISNNSKTDYISTPYCMASYLNASHLLYYSTKHYNERNLLKLIENNRLFDWLNANKYKSYNYSHFDAFGNNKLFNNYDHYFGRTIWYAILLKVYHYFKPPIISSQYNLNTFRDIQAIAKDKSDAPKFIYAHIMMPHGPYLFNKEGKPLSSDNSLSDKQKYLGQLLFTNVIVFRLVRNLLSSSDSNPIIIIQGDHGFRYLEDVNYSIKIEESHTIFFAIYSPFGNSIPNNINPTNTFKILVEKINNL